MNKQRRKALSAAIAKIEEAREEIERIKDEEQEAFDGIPEALQQGDKASTMQSGIDALGQAQDALESAINDITELAEG